MLQTSLMALKMLLGWRTGHFTAEELSVRVGRMLRGPARKTRAPDAGNRMVAGPYRLCRLTRTAMLDGTPIRLTAREFATAWLLLSSGAILPRQQIASVVWGAEASIAEPSIERHVYKLRKKLCFGEATGVEFKTVYARGNLLAVHEPTRQERRMQAA